MRSPDEPLEPNLGQLSESVDRLLDLGMNERAGELAMQAIAANPEAPEAHLSLGRVYLNTDPQKALGPLEEARRLDPTDVQVQWTIAWTHRELGHWAQAERGFLELIQNDPENASARAAYAGLLWQLDRPREALPWAEAALRLDPDNASLHALRSSLLLTTPSGDWSLSEQSARTALALNPQDLLARTVMGWVRMRARDDAAAETLFRGVLTEQPTHPMALGGLAELTMARNVLYRPLLRLSLAMSNLSESGRLAVPFALWVVYRSAGQALKIAGQEPLADLLLVAYLGLCAWTWFAGPITRMILVRAHPWLAEAS